MADQPSSAEAPGQLSDAVGADEATGEDEEPQPAPDDIMPLFFTTLTQQIFECTTGTDVTSENPRKLIQKEKILEDFKTRAAISDFHPVKKIVLVECIEQNVQNKFVQFFCLVGDGCI